MLDERCLHPVVDAVKVLLALPFLDVQSDQRLVMRIIPFSYRCPIDSSSIVLSMPWVCPNDLAPTVLVFGEFSRIPVHQNDLSAQRNRMSAMFLACQSMAKFMARTCLKSAANPWFQVPLTLT